MFCFLHFGLSAFFSVGLRFIFLDLEEFLSDIILDIHDTGSGYIAQNTDLLLSVLPK